MSTTEAFDYAESQFPLLSGVAFKAAYDRTLATGSSVYVTEDGSLYEVFPDKHRVFLQHVDPPMHIAPGTRFKAR